MRSLYTVIVQVINSDKRRVAPCPEALLSLEGAITVTEQYYDIAVYAICRGKVGGAVPR